ncbi:MAG: hypothetical protein A2Z72_01225 [Omnitrophica bacterium RBG_13_46_9]|nr:MAG: hypothetical protein A2Z72_01225 [Omnitrophica bacterium RBG_13_46_9]
MLNFLRKKKIAKRILWALAIIIIPAFVIWGAGSLSKQDSSDQYIGSIDGKKISVDKFIESIKDVQIGLLLSYFNQPQILSKIQNDRKFLNRFAWENLIIWNMANKERTSVSDKEVVGFVTRHPLFVRDGSFDNRIYNYILKNNLGINPRAFEESVRKFLINTKYRAGIVKNVTVSDEELRKAYKNEFEKAKVYYILIDKSDFKAGVNISEDEIGAFYEKGKDRFIEPEKVLLQYISFPHKEEGEKQKALADLKAAYEKLKARPRDMEKVAQKLGLEIKETPAFSQDEIVPEIGSAKEISGISFRMRPLLDILPIISEDERGVSYIIRVKEKILSRLKTVDEARLFIMETLKDEKALALAGERAQSLYEEAAESGISLKELAQKHSLELLQTDFVSRFDYVQGVGESYEITEDAFALGAGKTSAPIQTRKGFVLIEPLEFQFIDEGKYEMEKENYRDKILAAKKMKALQDWLSESAAGSFLNVNLDKI